MSQQKRIDKILEAIEGRIQEEVGALLGADFTLLSGDRVLVSKEAAFDSLKGKQIAALMDIVGDVEGKGCLLIGIKDAIRLGGTLIMLPSSELEECIGREEYSEEVEDSYGEIANIVAGSITKDFEEMYPKACRFIRKEQEILVPVKVDMAGDEPVKNETLYMVPMSMVLDGHQMGDLVLLMPAAAFELETEAVADNAPTGQEAADSQNTDTQDEREEGQGAPEESAGQPEESSTEKPANLNYDKHKKRVDKLLGECRERMESEISALLAVDITLTDLENEFYSKEDFFSDQVSGRQILADMEVVGDIQDQSYLCVSLKDAIYLGGVLIMLPPSELESTVAEEEFGEDANDAYGEVANIVSGVYTAIFEEQYLKKLRFIKKELHEVKPAKVDVSSEQPIPDRQFYVSSMSLDVDGKQLGKVQMLFPDEMLYLDQQEELQEKGAEQSQATSQQGTAQLQDQNAGTPQPESGSLPAEGVQSGAQETEAIDVEKHQKRMDKLLDECRQRMEEEVSALVGNDVTFSNLTNTVVDKETFFFDEVTGKQVIADLDVVGELEGRSYLSVNLKDAIRLGGELIMLPTTELETIVTEEDFIDDAKDAYGEIANIISGVYTAIFEEQYTKQVRFIKNELHTVAPMKVDIASDEPISQQNYYLSSMDVTFGSEKLGKANLLFPLDLFQLTGLVSGPADDIQESAGQVAEAASQAAMEEQGVSGSASEGSGGQRIDILLVGDDEQQAAVIAGVLNSMGYGVKSLSFKDNIHNYLPGELKAVYLVMRDVNEQAFGVAIKVSTACNLPVIAAGPTWTRTTVIKAVKYGVRDILLTPASEADIQENINNNLVQLAA